MPLDPKTLQLIRGIQEKTKSTNQLRSDDIAQWALFPRSHSKQTLYMHLRSKLTEVCLDIPTPEPIAPHRLRHTYATSLLNAGMSLSSVMRILGHHSLTTTLIYAAVAQETVREEFVTAVDKIQNRYHMPGAVAPEVEDRDGLTSISDAIRWFHQQVDIRDSGANRKARLLLKRLHRIKSELQELKNRVD